MNLGGHLKAVIRYCLSIAAYYLGVDALMYWINRRAKRIITFHNVMPDELMNGVPGVGCMETASAFRRKIDEMAMRFRFSADLDDAKTVTIAFDDGTLNECEIAGEILREKGIPACMFVAGDIIDARPEDALVTDKLLIWNEFAPDESAKRVFGVVLPRDELWVKYVQPAYREDWQNRGKKFLARLESVCTVDSLLAKLPREWVRLRMSGVTAAQLEDLRARGWKIGWHTWSHYPLGMLDSMAKRQELDSPKEYRDVALCYPYGDIGAIGEESLKIAEELGYPSALSNDPDYSPHRGRYFLMRMALPKNRFELHLVLSGLKYFIKYRRLLPARHGK